MTAALTLAVSRYFKEKNDKSKAFNICIPANIRWQMYQTAEEVRLENKFSPIPMRLQVETDPQKCLKQVKKSTAYLKHSFATTYFMYFLAICTSLVLPRFVNRYLTNMMS
jgi:hypothetical protein